MLLIYIFSNSSYSGKGSLLPSSYSVSSQIRGSSRFNFACRSNYEDESTKLYEFVLIFGAFLLILAQIPSFHSLRHINLISLLLCLTYSACLTIGAIYAGHSSQAPAKEYTILGDHQDHVFGAFNAIATITTT